MLFKKKNTEVDDNKIKVKTSTITTFIGKDCIVEGKIQTDASLRVDGTFIGDIRSKGVVILTPSGKVVGTIEAENIIVAGIMEGNMSIRDKVNVEPTGQIYGEIVTKKFVIDEESIFQGNCIMNRDGEHIPVTPYDKDGKDKEDKKEDKVDKENEEADSSKEESKKEDNKKEDAKNKDSENDKTDKTDKSESKKEKSGKKPENEDKKASDKSEEEKESADDEEKDAAKDSKQDKKEADDDIEISDIDELDTDSKSAEYIDSQEVSNPRNSYVKKSKSLSVEIEKRSK